VQVFSLHSTSKGFLGECGHRGGYLDALNCPSELRVQLEKLMSISLCSNTAGQVLFQPAHRSVSVLFAVAAFEWPCGISAVLSCMAGCYVYWFEKELWHGGQACTLFARLATPARADNGRHACTPPCARFAPHATPARADNGRRHDVPTSARRPISPGVQAAAQRNPGFPRAPREEGCRGAAQAGRRHMCEPPCLAR
jgi:hypothetical protein